MSELGQRKTPPALSATIALAVEDARLAEDLVNRFEPSERDEMVIFDDPQFLIDHPTLVRAEVTIISLYIMKNLAKYHMTALSEFCHHNKAVLLIRSQEFLDSVGYLEFVDGVVFYDATISRLREIINLARDGYSILPSAAVMDIVTDRLRCDSVGRLTAMELSILDQIRLAKTNRAIARSLGLTEANVKTKVRAILKSLKFQNRTEAAVFAARQTETIRSAMSRRAPQPPQPPQSEMRH